MMEPETIATGTALALVEKMTAVELFKPGVLDPLVDRIKAEVRATPSDVTTDKGRAAIGTLARKVSSTKVAIDRMRLDLVAAEKKRLAVIDAEGKRFRDEMDALRDEVLAPRDAYEALMAKRAQMFEARIVEIKDCLNLPLGWNTSAECEAAIDKARALQAAGGWEEFAQRAEDAMAISVGHLMGLRETHKTREAETAEAAIAAAAKAEEDRLVAIEVRRLRDKAIAKAAAGAARIAAETRAREEREAEAKRVEAERLTAERRAEEAAQAIRDAAERAQREAQARQDEIEAQRLKAVRDAEEARQREEKRRVHDHERAIESVQGMIRDAHSPFNNSGMIEHIRRMIGEMDEVKRDYEEFQDRFDGVIKIGYALIDKRLAEVKEAEREATERANKGAAEKVQRDQDAAIAAERKRVADAEAAKAAEDAERAKDVAHRKSVNAAARDDLIEAGLSAEAATVAVKAIARGSVRRATINY